MRTHLGTLALCLMLGPLTRAADPVPPVAELRPAKAEYVAGEPIGVVVTIRNVGTVPLEFRLSYPFHFMREMSTVRFDGGPAIPRLEDRPLMLSGPIVAFVTRIPAGQSWSATVFLQNYLAGPSVGEWKVGYRFEATYRAASQTFERDDPFKDDYPTVTSAGTLAIRVKPADRGVLARVMMGHARAFLDPEADRDDRDRMGEAIEAFRAFEGPGVVPFVGAALKALDRPDAGFIPGLYDLLEVLKPFRDREDARRVVRGLVSSENGGLGPWAMEWLRDNSVPVEAGLLAKLLDRADERKETPLYVLSYLRGVAVPATPALRERVARCVILEDMEEVVLALGVLARWGADPDPAVRKALDRVAEAAKHERSFQLGQDLEVLGAWKYPLGVEDLRGLLDRDAHQAIPAFEKISTYLLAVGVEPYRTLEPRIAARLDHRFQDVTLAALQVLYAMGHVLTPDETKKLLDLGPVVRKATEAYLRGRPEA
jgi:hypothetical protein